MNQLTHKEDAERLVEIFMPHAESEYADSTAQMRGAHKEHAKECALICVSEIIKTIKSISLPRSVKAVRLVWLDQLKHEIRLIKNVD